VFSHFRYNSTVMSRRSYALLSVAIFEFVVSWLLLRPLSRKMPPALPAASLQQEPLLMLWAWETPEDFSTLDPKQAGVAFLARELLLGQGVSARPRYQPMRLASGIWLLAVVRIETAPSFTPNAEFARRTALAIAEVAQLPNVRGIQVDVDATASQHNFYAMVLRDLRQSLPTKFPLSVTACELVRQR
jgi:hypothetical protein